ncbi:blast:Putative cysteine proteinase CG12163 [Drosophila guanche]|uniref:Blast:Putative cysteine proteinase CG12163 n=1 Tax=Drosophila guanche TaxID=7266 RepID=A0A3B0KLC9_DROGU|nr:blast:Putative cysteine proteinase CG12163 [Drosophila guanche]
MKPSPLMTRIRQIWIMTGWLRHEAAAAAGMMVVRRQEGLSQEDSQGDEPEAAAEAMVGQVGVDTEGKLRKVRILDDYIVPFECDSFKMGFGLRFVILCPLIHPLSCNGFYFQFVRSKRGLNDVPLGHSKPFDAKQAEAQLQRTLDKLTAGEGPHYKIVKVYTASRQVVSGTLTRIDADLIDGNTDVQHRCIVEIWAQPWLEQGHDITFKCRNQKVVQARHSRSVEWAEKKTHKKHSHSHSHHALDKVDHLFHKFQIRFERRYDTTAERQMRMRIFRQNLKTIEELNANEMGSAKYGITEFADMTSTEYKERTGLWQRDELKPTGGAPAVVPKYEGEFPKEFDWRQKNAVTQVKNQGSCGSCWAFSVTGNIEGLYAVKTGELKEFSEQELLDCDTTDSACNGGLMDNAYKAIKDIGGLEYEAEYPYEAKKKQCHFNRTLSHVQVSGFVDLPKGNETAMQEWLLTHGPISIGLNANAMQFYRGGVSHPWKTLCSKKNLDHGVLIVGYGVSDYPNFHKTLPYWIVKNSWGPRWGEQGYYRVYRGDNTCGVSEMATSAVLA